MNIFYLDHDPVLAARYMCDKHIHKMALESMQMLSTAHRLLDGEEFNVDGVVKYDTELKIFKKPRKLAILPKIGEKFAVDPSGRKLAELKIYLPTHANHPSNKWVRSSRAHYEWLVNHTYQLFAEHFKRYGKVSKSMQLLEFHLAFPPRNIADTSFIAPPQAMPEDYQGIDTVTAYRRFYKIGKPKTMKVEWKLNNVPEWFTSGE